MTSAPASACTSAWRTSWPTLASLTISSPSISAVMAVAGIGVERHVGDEPDLRHRRLDGAAGGADEVFGLSASEPVGSRRAGSV